MKLSVKKFSKKSLSLLIALIMAFSAVPFSPLSSPIEANAAETKTTILVWDASRATTNTASGARYSYQDSQTKKTISGIQWGSQTHNSTYLTVSNTALSFAEISNSGAITGNDNIINLGISGNKWSFSAKFAYCGSSTKTTVFGLASTTKRDYTQSNTGANANNAGGTEISNGYVADLVDIRADGTVYIGNKWNENEVVSGISSDDLASSSATDTKILTVTYDNGNLTIDINGKQKISQTVDTALFSAGVGNYLAGPNVQVFSGANSGIYPHYQVTNNGDYLYNMNLYSLSGATYEQEGSEPKPPTNRTASVVGYGAVKKSGNNRASGTTITIVNDQQDDNFGIGFVNFDISSLSNTGFNVGSANYNMTYSIAANEREAMGLSFYYATKNDTVFDSTGQGVNLTDTGISSNVYGTGNQHIAKAKTYLGLQKIADVVTYTNKSNEPFSVDISPAIRYALSKGETKCQLLIMLTNAGGEGEYNLSRQSKYWTDTAVTVNTSSVPVTLQTDADYVRDHISSANKTYTNIYVNNADSNFMSGVISGSPFVDTTAVTINDYDSNSSNSISLKIFGMPNAVAVYTGTSSDIRFPVVFENSGYNNASGVRTWMSVDHISLSSGNFAMSGENWDRCSSWNNLTYYNETTFDFYSTSDGNFAREQSKDQNKFLTSDQKTWRNYIKYTGSGDTNNYYEKLTSAKFNFQADLALNWKKGIYWSQYNTGTDGANCNRDLTYPLGLYVLNYKPLNDIVISPDFTNNYDEISKNSWKYTKAGLNNYYAVVADIIDFNLAHESMTSESEVRAVARKIKDLVTRYKDYNSPQRKTLTLTFNRTDGTNDTMEILAGNAIGTLPANSSATHIEGTNTHNGYIWEGATSATIPQSDKEYSETPAVANCSGGTATCTQKAICSSCNTEYGSLDKHSFETGFPTPGKVKAPEGYNNGYTYQGCANCDAEDPNRVAYRVYDKTDWSAYNAEEIVAQEEIQNTAKYTAESIKKVTDIIQQVTPNDERKSQKYINDMTTALTEAVETLDLNQYSITFDVVNEYGNSTETVINAQSYDYGTLLNLQLPDTYQENAVSAWKRNINGADSVVGATSHSLQVMVTGNATYTAFVKKATTASGNQAVITLNNKSNKVYDIGYVENNNVVEVIVDVDNGTITIGGKKLTAPTYSFYKVKGFKINGKTVNTGTINITGDIVIKPEYEAISSFTITGGKGVVEKSTTTSWDQRVRLTAETPAQSGKINKWTSTINGQNVVWGYGDTLSFQATQACTVECTAVDATEFNGVEDVKLSVDYVSYNLYRSNSITAISRVIAPEGTVVEYGTILKTANIKSGASNENYETQKLAVDNKDNYKVTNKSGVFKSTQMISNTNQFAYNFYSAQNYDKMYVGAVAYAKLSDGTYVYSDVVTYEFK